MDGGGKVPLSTLPPGIMEYKGTWDPTTNTPTLANGTGTAGWFYKASEDGTYDFGAGGLTFRANDWAIYNGAIWERSDQSDAVVSVAGLSGVVDSSALTDALTDGSVNKVYSAADKARLANTSGTNTGDQTTISGNAGSATVLASARNIDGQAFDGSGNITVIAPGTHAATSKATPADADEIPLADSGATYSLKKLTWANLRATILAALPSLATGASASTLAERDAQANLSADAFIPSVTSTVTGSGTTTLTVDSTEIQVLTGTANQTVQLPTTGVAAGQRYTIINQTTGGGISVNASNGSQITAWIASNNFSGTFTALQATPTTPAHWAYEIKTNYRVTSGAVAGTVATRDSNANLLADAFIPGFTTTATAAGTTTLTVASNQVQVFTGTTTQTVSLPTTGVAAGQRYTIVNQSTGVVTVNASDATLVAAINANQFVEVTALQATPTTSSHWLVAGAFLNAGFLISTAVNGASVLRRDGNGSVFANALIPSRTSVATAASTTTLTVASTQVQQFTGTATQTCVLPTTSVTAGQSWTIINQSSGTVSVQSSSTGTVLQVNANRTATFVARVDTPVNTTDWAIMGASALTTASNGSVALRDASANLTANNFVPSETSTATAAATTTLTIASAQVQVFTGTSTQTVVLPTASVTAGMAFTIANQSTGDITVQSSGANTIAKVHAGYVGEFVALKDTPTAATDWTAFTPDAAGTRSSTLAMRDANASLSANAFISAFASTATAAGTTTLTVSSAEIQQFTGTTTQTVLLPTTGVVAGQRYTIINSSTGSVTVQSSGANTVATLAGGAANTFVALVATPTTAANWAAVG
ncbi:hypothetical protein [Mycolicibacterium sphagni]|uniref:hypothetical protein n=1 Tax=Mycolicibacterium sphagni TaxID=1786 RepID=UPI0021F35888|nr:hypothetical protein [Mycolicibacterium sphagni]MCV7174948.1 hypothetical protein [Mycolicibacterium sphagni]